MVIQSFVLIFGKQKLKSINISNFHLKNEFSGVGRSTGSSSWRGNSEKVDVQSVCEYLFQLSNESFKSIPKEDIPSIEKILIVSYLFYKKKK